jgi:hypothetical protein
MTDSQRIQKRLEQLLAAAPLAPDMTTTELPLLELVPAGPQPEWCWLPGAISSLANLEWLPRVVSEVDVTALKAGLLLMHDFVDESHRYSQSIEGEGEHQLGDYWHAILHRREPDYFNAKYWFRQIGQQPGFAELARLADARLRSCSSPRSLEWNQRLGSAQQWKPLVFVDLCEWCQAANDPELMQATREIQRAEMLLLLQQTYRQAMALRQVC